MKRCPHCRQTLPLESFHINHDRPNGARQSWCKQCKAAALREHRSHFSPDPGATHVKPFHGERHYGAKLTDEDVKLIRGLLPSLSCAEIARKFEVSRQCISDIKHGKNWYRLH
jgi:hypothetical protein